MAQNREFDREVTVYVWKYHNVVKMGHAAVSSVAARPATPT